MQCATIITWISLLKYQNGYLCFASREKGAVFFDAMERRGEDEEEHNDDDSNGGNNENDSRSSSLRRERMNSIKVKQATRSESAKRSLTLPREHSIELVSPRDIAGFRSPRNLLFPVPQQSFTQTNTSDRAMSQVNMSSIDLDDVEVFRLTSTTNGVDMTMEYQCTGYDTSSGTHTSTDDLFANMMASGDSLVNLFSSHIGGMSDPNFSVDCGNCGELEIRVRGIEMQLDELRTAVETAGTLKKHDSNSSKKGKSWKDRLFGGGSDLKAAEEREKLIREMEALLKAVNFMLRKMDEVKIKCRNLK